MTKRQALLGSLGTLACAASLLAAQLAGATPADRKPAKATSSIDIRYDDTSGYELSGVVKAETELNDEPSCVTRTVNVSRKRPGHDQHIATVQSKSTKYGYGLWGVNRDHPFPSGRYRASMPEERGDGRVICEPAHSDLLRVP